ncbi:hypothetical protein DPMN_041828 [Dreissena polymorpha]|uniref:Uncharacterized protein n=1 Tax=Dreissena polymorpha TaxID=45954 RepID=A0A9D4HWE6_DREPO|nr:hypothetical protein DPMN_041828 [Dreissena polymorpha]
METVDNVENNIQQKRTLISKINSDRLPKPVSKIYDVELIRRLLQDCALYSPHNKKGVVKTSSRSASATDADEHNIYPEEDVHYQDEERRKQGRREVWGSLLGGSNKPTRRWHFAPTPISEIKKQRIWYLNLQRRRRVEPRNDDPSEPSRPATPSSAGDASAWEYDTEEERLAYMTEETDGPFGQVSWLRVY